MGFYTGRTGKLEVYVGSAYKPVAKIRDWSLETSVELLPTNAIDSTVNTYTPGVKSSSGSATLLYYRLESGEDVAYVQFTEILRRIHKIGAVTADDRVRMRLRVSDAENDDIQFNAYITTAQLGVSTGELVAVPIQFTVDGDFLAGGVVV